jgi:hypothetical protein
MEVILSGDDGVIPLISTLFVLKHLSQMLWPWSSYGGVEEGAYCCIKNCGGTANEIMPDICRCKSVKYTDMSRDCMTVSSCTIVFMLKHWHSCSACSSKCGSAAYRTNNHVHCIYTVMSLIMDMIIVPVCVIVSCDGNVSLVMG